MFDLHASLLWVWHALRFIVWVWTIHTISFLGCYKWHSVGVMTYGVSLLLISYKQAQRLSLYKYISYSTYYSVIGFDCMFTTPNICKHWVARIHLARILIAWIRICLFTNRIHSFNLIIFWGVQYNRKLPYIRALETDLSVANMKRHEISIVFIEFKMKKAAHFCTLNDVSMM